LKKQRLRILVAEEGGVAEKKGRNGEKKGGEGAGVSWSEKGPGGTVRKEGHPEGRKQGERSQAVSWEIARKRPTHIRKEKRKKEGPFNSTLYLKERGSAPLPVLRGVKGANRLRPTGPSPHIMGFGGEKGERTAVVQGVHDPPSIASPSLHEFFLGGQLGSFGRGEPPRFLGTGIPYQPQKESRCLRPRIKRERKGGVSRKSRAQRIVPEGKKARNRGTPVFHQNQFLYQEVRKKKPPEEIRRFGAGKPFDIVVKKRPAEQRP